MGGILDSLGGMFGAASAPATSSPITAILQMLMQRQGGLSGLVNSLQQSGLGDAVSSWISTGQNQAVSGSQLGGIFSSDALQQLTQHFGGDEEAAQNALAEHLPNIVDKLSPNGSLPEGDDWMQNAGDMMGGLLK